MSSTDAPFVSASDATGRRIFCVDDDPISQRILVAALVRPGWSVECACDGEDALQRYAGDTRGFDVLVTDHHMPGIDGLELVRRLREIGFRGEVFVISAAATPAMVAEYLMLGVGAIFQKPIDLDALRMAVAAGQMQIVASPE